MNKLKNFTEIELLEQLKLGDHRAFELLYEKYSSNLSGNIYKIIKSEELTSEILQQLFIRVWDNRKSIQPDKSFKSYLFRVSQNLIMDHFRKITIDTRYKEYALMNYSELYTHVEENIIEKQSKEEFERLLLKLPSKCRQVFILSKIEELSHKEISEKLGISLPTVNNHMTKANKLLKKYIRDDFANGLVITVLILSLLRI